MVKQCVITERKTEKQLCENEYQRHSLYLEELVKERLDLEALATSLSEKYEVLVAEKKALNDEHQNNLALIETYTGQIQEIKNEMSTMKSIVTQTFSAQNVDTRNVQE
eukprot:TRINITY_DN3812_c0_g1_i2.p1 TRINITY_DN3812_c0_g1~~TRINITY_DN3812_c0_g1_i2.p1  ORF type:complete len:108 (-),score=25.98 TRINITY_DN3812_c0_g1_i2:136-459(-)